jgi:GxxExxY protein
MGYSDLALDSLNRKERKERRGMEEAVPRAKGFDLEFFDEHLYRDVGEHQDPRSDEAMKDIKQLCDRVRQIAYDIHVYHGHGHLEKVYENALASRLAKVGLTVKQQHPLNVFDEDGTLLGAYLADLLVDDVLIVEVKTARTLAPEHQAQIIGYLKSARIEHGLLINFGSYKFEIRKFAWSEPLQRSKADS